MNELNFNNAMNTISEIIICGNTYLSKNEFWTIKDEKILEKTFYLIFEITRILASLLQSFTPEISKEVLECLSISNTSLESLSNLFTTETFKIDQAKRKKFMVKKLQPPIVQ